MDSLASRRDKAKGEAKPKAEGAGCMDDDCYMTRVTETLNAERPKSSVPTASLHPTRQPGGNSAKASWENPGKEEEEEEDCVILGEARSKKPKSNEAMIAEDESLAWSLGHPGGSPGQNIPSLVLHRAREHSWR